MKKLLAAVVTALLLALAVGAGLAFSTGATAQAGPGAAGAARPAAVGSGVDAQACQYPTCIPTRTHIKGRKKLHPGKSISFRVTVRPRQGTARPVGKIKWIVRHHGGGFKKTGVARYTGPKQRFGPVGPLPRGAYKVAARYIPKPGSVFQKSKYRYQLKVRPRKRG